MLSTGTDIARLPMGVLAARVDSLATGGPTISNIIMESSLILSAAMRSITLATEVAASGGREFLVIGFVKIISSLMILPMGISVFAYIASTVFAWSSLNLLLISSAILRCC